MRSFAALLVALAVGLTACTATVDQTKTTDADGPATSMATTASTTTTTPAPGTTSSSTTTAEVPDDAIEEFVDDHRDAMVAILEDGPPSVRVLSIAYNNEMNLVFIDLADRNFWKEGTAHQALTKHQTPEIAWDVIFHDPALLPLWDGELADVLNNDTALPALQVSLNGLMSYRCDAEQLADLVARTMSYEDFKRDCAT